MREERSRDNLSGMGALARLQSSSCANPVLDVYTMTNGVLTDVASLKYQIWDTTAGLPGTQVYPVTPGEKAIVDVDTDCPAGDRLSQGHYVARWDVPGNANVGTWQIKWFIQLTLAVAEQTYTEDFEVLPEAVGSGTYPAEDYCLVSDLRDEGVTETVATDAWLTKRISLASRFIEATTKRFFYARSMTIRVDGRGGPKVLLNDPIIAVSKVEFDTTPYAPSATAIELDLIRVYNRHLSQRLTSPDDRDNPKIELFNPAEQLYQYGSARTWSNLVFPRGQQNVLIEGVFGYTDPDPDSVNTQGKTPELIRHVCKLIVIKELDKMSRTGARFDRRHRHRLTSERTRDQAYTLEPLGTRAGAFFTGDPEIDNILASFLRPPSLGAA